VGRDRAVVDDAPARRRLLAHDPIRRLCAVKGTVEVRRHHLAPLLGRDGLERSARAEHARVVEQEVDPPETLVHVREEHVDVGGVGDVERRHDCRLAAGGGLLQRRTPAAGQHDLPAVIQQRLGGRAADA
jgi:hypothetical protein